MPVSILTPVTFLLICLITGFGFSAKAYACREKNSFPYNSDPFPFNSNSLPFDSGEKYCPADIQSFMDRFKNCEYIFYEEPYNDRTRKALALISDENQCEKISCDREAMLEKYAGSKFKKIIQDYVSYILKKTRGDKDYYDKYAKCKSAKGK